MASGSSGAPWFRAKAVLVGIVCLSTATVATAGWFTKKGAVEQPDQTTSKPNSVTEAAPILVATDPTALWTGVLPLSHGPLPEGLANLSAQGCNACHSDTFAEWGRSAHGQPVPDSLLAAATAANQPACLQCHQPLAEQHRTVWQYDAGRTDSPIQSENTAFDATLSVEGVTCAACHIREGRVVGSNPHAAPAPHRSGWSASLGKAEACAPCHQLTWPGADRPLYDTIGEFERSAYPAAGVQCATCHMSDAAGHDMDLPLKQALSVLLSIPPAALTRGAPAQAGVLTIQNTGAGHAVPTGSPYKALRLTLRIEGPGKKKGSTKIWQEVLSHDFARTLSDAPPWTTTSDSRLAAGASQSWPISLELPVDAPTGDYELVATLTESRGDRLAASPAWERRYPLPVQ